MVQGINGYSVSLRTWVLVGLGLILFAAPIFLFTGNLSASSQVNYSKFWNDTFVQGIYGYGDSTDLSDLYTLLSAIEYSNPSLPNPMKRMPGLPTEVWGTRWDYADSAKNDSRKYCTDFLGAVILLKVCSYKEAVQAIMADPKCAEQFNSCWNRFGGYSVWLLDDRGRLLEGNAGTNNFIARDPNSIAINVLKLLNRNKYLFMQAYTEMTPIGRPYHLFWIIELHKKGGIMDG